MNREISQSEPTGGEAQEAIFRHTACRHNQTGGGGGGALNRSRFLAERTLISAYAVPAANCSSSHCAKYDFGRVSPIA